MAYSLCFDFYSYTSAMLVALVLAACLLLVCGILKVFCLCNSLLTKLELDKCFQMVDDRSTGSYEWTDCVQRWSDWCNCLLAHY